MRTRIILHASALGLLILSLVASPGGDEAYGAPNVTDLGRSFLGPDGAPLPFLNDAQILEFLRTAEVIDEKPIGKGINRSRKVVLEKDGVRARAAFRETDRRTLNAFIAGRSYPVFRDSYLFEPAAYQLAKLLGIHNVPPAVLRRIGGRDGSLQLWIENVRSEEEGIRPLRPPDIDAWIRQLRDMILFDNLVFNGDRNTGNMLITENHTLMMIDHTRAFQQKPGLVDPERLTHVNRQTWERLRSLTEKEISDAVRPFLSPDEISMLHVRRQRVIDHLTELIRARGEEIVVH